MQLLVRLLSLLMLFQTTAENMTLTFQPPDAFTTEEVTATEPQEARQLIGTFTCYAYCPCTRCCGENASGITATGATATAGRTIAVDPDVIPLGTELYIDGVGWFVAEDTGGGIKGNTLDMFMDSHDAALQWGVKTVEVYMMTDRSK